MNRPLHQALGPLMFHPQQCPMLVRPQPCLVFTSKRPEMPLQCLQTVIHGLHAPLPSPKQQDPSLRKNLTRRKYKSCCPRATLRSISRMISLLMKIQHKSWDLPFPKLWPLKIRGWVPIRSRTLSDSWHKWLWPRILLEQQCQKALRVDGNITKFFLCLAADFGLVMNDLTQCQSPCYLMQHKAAQIPNNSGQLQVLTRNYNNMVLQNYPKYGLPFQLDFYRQGQHTHPTRCQPNWQVIHSPLENLMVDSQAKEQPTPSSGRLYNQLFTKVDCKRQQRPLGIAKLSDTNNVGHRCSKDCTFALELCWPKAGWTPAWQFPEAHQQANVSQDTPTAALNFMHTVFLTRNIAKCMLWHNKASGLGW